MFWSTIRPYIWDRPLIDFGEGRLLAPWPSMLMRHALYGVESLLSGSTKELWLDGFSKAVEDYAGEELAAAFGDSSVHRLDGRKEIKAVGSVSDFLVDKPGFRLFVEIKTARDNRPAFIPHELPGVNFASQIRKGVKQVRASAAADTEITACLGLDSTAKPIYGMVVLLEDAVAVNTPWFWEHAIQLPRTDCAGRDAEGALRFPPQIASLDLLEVFAHLCTQSGVDFNKLIEDQQAADESAVRGDWIQELNHQFDDIQSVAPRSVVAMDSYIEKLAAQVEEAQAKQQ